MYSSKYCTFDEAMQLLEIKEKTVFFDLLAHGKLAPCFYGKMQIIDSDKIKNIEDDFIYSEYYLEPLNFQGYITPLDPSLVIDALISRSSDFVYLNLVRIIEDLTLNRSFKDKVQVKNSIPNSLVEKETWDFFCNFNSPISFRAKKFSIYENSNCGEKLFYLDNCLFQREQIKDILLNINNIAKDTTIISKFNSAALKAIKSLNLSVQDIENSQPLSGKSGVKSIILKYIESYENLGETVINEQTITRYWKNLRKKIIKGEIKLLK